MFGYKHSSRQTGLVPWPPFEEEGVEVLEGDLKQSGRVDCGRVEGPMAVGIWDGTPGKVRLTNPFSELCTVRKGCLTVTDSEGEQTTFGPGDSFFIAQGEVSTWDILEGFEKTFFLHIDCDP